MTPLNLQQQKAISRDANLSVTAGAGAGKTLLLVERYIDILLTEQVDVNQILAITFTKKAAAEMKNRVVDEISTKLEGKLSNPERRKLIRARERMNSAAISTIHSFCARLLKEYPIEAGLDPDFRQLNDTQQQLLMESELDQLLDALQMQPDKWLSLFRWFEKATIRAILNTAESHRYEMQAILPMYLDSSVNAIYESWQTDFITYMHSLVTEQDIAIISQDVNLLLHNIPEVYEDDPRSIRTISCLRKYHENAQTGGIPFWQALFDLCDHFTTSTRQAYTKTTTLAAVGIWSPDSLQKMIALSQQAAKIIRYKLNVPDITDKPVIEQMQKFYQLYQMFNENYNQRKRSLGVLDYDDLQICTLNLLNQNDQVKKKTAESYRYIMVDEFQDTNMLQWQIIQKLGALHEHKFFIVGDPKQSIYGFRNADIRVFKDVKYEFQKFSQSQNSASDIILNQSFRFTPVLCEFINRTFRHILKDDDQNRWDVGYDDMIDDRKADKSGQVDLAVLHEDDQARFLASHIEHLSETCAYNQMAILLRTRTHLSEIEEACRARDIPFVTVGGIGFYQRQEISDMYHLVHFLISPHDDLALVAVLRSPFVQVSDEWLFYAGTQRQSLSFWEFLNGPMDKDKISESDRSRLDRFKELAAIWLQKRERMAFHELLSLILTETDYLAVLNAQLQGERYTANMDKIMEMAIEFESAGFLTLTDFADSLHNLILRQDKEGEAQTELAEQNAVQIMTVHQAKGLEFDVVFFPYLEQELRQTASSHTLFNETFGVSAPVNGIIANKSESSYYLHDRLRAEQRTKELAELKRIFYVACTRARDHLVLSMNLKNHRVPADTCAQWLLTAHDLDVHQLQDGSVVNNMHMITEIDYDENISNTMIMALSENLNKIFSASFPKSDNPLFGEIADRPKGEIFSATQLMMFDQDPSAYEQRYHLGFFPDDYQIPVRFQYQEDHHMLMGRVAHRYFEEYPDFSLTRVFNDLDITLPEIQVQIVREIELLQKRVSDSQILNEIFKAGEYRNEISITMKINGDYLAGTLDRIYKDSQGFWHILDYKTNRISEFQLEQTFAKYGLQMQVYALLLAQIYPEQAVYPVSLYFTHLDRIKSYNYTPGELENIEQQITQKISAIKHISPF